MSKYVRPKHLSDAGARFIGRFEGLRLDPYDDPAGHATIGYGHLIHYGKVTQRDRVRWREFNEHAALKLLEADAELASVAVRTLVKAKLNQAQHDALVSFAFNVGVGGFRSSTLLKKLNKHPGTAKGIVGEKALEEVKAELLRWDRAGGAELPGLRRRRLAEARLFASGRYS